VCFLKVGPVRGFVRQSDVIRRHVDDANSPVSNVIQYMHISLNLVVSAVDLPFVSSVIQDWLSCSSRTGCVPWPCHWKIKYLNLEGSDYNNRPPKEECRPKRIGKRLKSGI
jgi:hypothetical protein